MKRLPELFALPAEPAPPANQLAPRPVRVVRCEAPREPVLAFRQAILCYRENAAEADAGPCCVLAIRR